MSGTWDGQWQGFPGGPGSGSEPPAEERRRRTQLPRTFVAQESREMRLEKAFDPALLHFSRAFRVSEPRFADPSAAVPWRAARREALDAVLAAVERGGWAESLVLRGSALLAGWLGDAAREPGDLDFVVTPRDWRIEEPRTDRMLAGIAAAATEAAQDAGGLLSIRGDKARSEFIWTYERVPGRRMVLPWAVPGLPGGLVQLDFVFGEELPEPPRRTRVAVSGASGAELYAAGPELSLAWKLIWLYTDLHPQGKDLYDAVLLAERYPLPYDLLQAAYRASGDRAPDSPVGLTFEDVREAVESYGWHHFREEYPHLAAEQQHYGQRLLAALRPVFEGH